MKILKFKFKIKIIIFLSLFIILLVSILCIRQIEKDYKKYNRQDDFNYNKPYHPKNAIKGYSNFSEIDDCLFDENLKNSYARLYISHSYNFSFQTSNTGIFLFYYIIRSNGNFLINNTIVNAKKNFEKDYDFIGFTTNKTIVNIIITSINDTIDIAEIFGLDMNYLDVKPKLNKITNEYIYLIEWKKLENWFKSIFK